MHHGVNIYSYKTILINVHTWTAVFSWHLTNTSCMASIRACTEPISGPFLRACILLPCPARCITVYDDDSSFTPTPSATYLGGFSLMYKSTSQQWYMIQGTHLCSLHYYYYSCSSLHFFHFSGQADCPPFPLSVTLGVSSIRNSKTHGKLKREG